ncbi:protein-glutamate O-methyltransferase CheR [Candidatus Sulfurimonas marisnigri]|uniref:protein-glutamate O-methyltransferase n=1 Tax=Candidatus Sulfurimonas marisnigri TaxID=2740405 RepID=A0A7S7M1A3_9BACT|nr:protein-glutamate O-methyltransferase CheR [Candidatus Sulfurimonas marisnigri]QOY55296.1 protein-glutamate O-methyltransferase CheR [Candidatus Sulfurimonas marisnigri]
MPIDKYSVLHVKITDGEYIKYREIIYETTGIELKENKHNLIESRLMKRLRYYNMSSYSEYYQLVLKDRTELQLMINQVTTNETSFFRENKHFDYLVRRILPEVNEQLRIWSAASSIGVEAYTIAMVVDEVLSIRHLPFEILASDINIDVLSQAKQAVYDIKFSKNIPDNYLRQYCLKGVGDMQNKFAIKDYLKNKLSFAQINLTKPISPNVGKFDIIFLRNVLIYFDIQTKQNVVKHVLQHLKPNGYFFIGHSESLFNISDEVVQVMPTVYQKVVL